MPTTERIATFDNDGALWVKEFPPRREPGSFSVEQAMEKLRKSAVQQ